LAVVVVVAVVVLAHSLAAIVVLVATATAALLVVELFVVAAAAGLVGARDGPAVAYVDDGLAQALVHVVVVGTAIVDVVVVALVVVFVVLLVVVFVRLHVGATALLVAFGLLVVLAGSALVHEDVVAGTVVAVVVVVPLVAPVVVPVALVNLFLIAPVAGLLDASFVEGALLVGEEEALVDALAGFLRFPPLLCCKNQSLRPHVFSPH
jgi:hypothetical protein